LKKLQGYLWHTGYSSGEITTPLFPDVTPRLTAWKHRDNLTLAIFSSGSVEAQKLFFAHIGGESSTEDLNPLFEANFDTVNAGPKMVRESYEKIASRMGKNVGEILFLSDNVNGMCLLFTCRSTGILHGNQKCVLRRKRKCKRLLSIGLGTRCCWRRIIRSL
jgi:2,3-diketo-5-methylthio-1-phosphopentane phosphatase